MTQGQGVWRSSPRTMAILGCLVALALSTGPAVAGGNGADVEKEFPVSYVLSSADCPNLPPGTTITATGTGTSITSTRTDAAGVTTVINTTHSTGTATDQAGNTYVWSYSNHTNLSSSPAAPEYSSGTMVDHFSLSGNGPARLSNGFFTRITFGPNPDWPLGFYAEPVEQHGLPITFPDGVGPFCDPL